MYYACLCAIAKDEDHALPEWVRHHLHIGFEHIYLYDNMSRRPARELLRAFIARNLVTVIDHPVQERPQLAAYAASLGDFGPGTVWMGYIDLDEFLVPRDTTDIRDLLDDYRQHAALAAHWKIFGSNGHETRPRTGVVTAYTGVIEANNHIKSIIQPRKTLGVASPHHFRHVDGQYCVNEDHVPVLTHHSYHTARRIQVNHYYYKSREDFAEKMQRGLATPAKGGRTVRDAAEYEAFERQFALPGVPDDAVARLYAAGGPPNAPEDTDLAALAARLHRDCACALPAFAAAIAAHMQAASLREAHATLHRCLRYHDTPAAWLMAARLHLLGRDKNRALPYLAAVLADLHAPLRGDAYRCLAAWHRACGRADTAARILAELAEM